MATLPAIASAILLSATTFSAPDVDTDGDGLPDLLEVHTYLTDPSNADSDGDGVPDGAWDERREFTYSVRAVMHVMAPFDTATMDDDRQDVRVLAETPDLLEFEVVVYPLSTIADAIDAPAPVEADERATDPFPPSSPWTRPGVCSTYDDALREALVGELRERGVDLDALGQADRVRAVSARLMERARYEDGCTTFAVTFDDRGAPRIDPRQAGDVRSHLARADRTIDEQYAHELFGAEMFDRRVHGSCTSTAIYLTSGLRAVGIPTRTVVCVPVVDANDAREVAWISSRIAHVGVRRRLLAAARRQEGSWTSHTFNEVFVDGRWRRLNDDRLGYGVLDDTIGLYVHVHTFADHSEAGLVGWGARRHHPQHAALFGGPNPYSCISLSDRFGAHSDVPNELFDDMARLTITRVGWFDAPGNPSGVETDLAPPLDRYLYVAFDASEVEPSDAVRAYLDTTPAFVLRAEGRPDVALRHVGKFWGREGVFLLALDADDRAVLDPGSAYAIVPSDEAAASGWSVERGVRLRP